MNLSAESRSSRWPPWRGLELESNVEARSECLSISGHWFRECSLGQLLNLLRTELGVSSVGLWPHNYAGLTSEEIRAALREEDAHAYALNVPSTEWRLNTGSDPESAQMAIIEALQLAYDLGSGLVQTYCGTQPAANIATSVEVFADELRPCVLEAERLGVVLAVENNLDQKHEDPAGTNPSRAPESLLDVAKTVSSPNFGVVYDACNFLAVGEEPFPGPYELLREHIVSVELKDVVRYRHGLHGKAESLHLLNDGIEGAFLPVPVGQGALNTDGLLRRLANDSYDGPLVLDPFARGAALLPYCASSLAYIRSVIDVASTDQVPAAETMAP